MLGIRRREFISLLGGAAAWPLTASAQQGDRLRRIGVLMAYDENDPLAKLLVSAFTQALADLGWTDGRNMRMDLRWTRDDFDRHATARRSPADQPIDLVAGELAARAQRIGHPLDRGPVRAHRAPVAPPRASAVNPASEHANAPHATGLLRACRKRPRRRRAAEERDELAPS